ncbi:MAG: hypothetical protein JXA22_10720 [Candidatus Thermoplasmatota archaeon]|nr:hypothetical protein [Candidatus Thermoplasmatota archaeon]
MSPSLFKRSGSSAVKLVSATKNEINQYSQMLSGQGYTMIGNPIEYRQPMSQQQLRDSVKGYAAQNNCYLVVEVNDPNPAANPYNPYKFYLFQHRSGQHAPEPTQPPSKGGAPAASQQAQNFAQFTCPYCRSVFQAYVRPGQNVLTCTACRGQSMVDIPASSFGQQAVPGANDPQSQMRQIKLRSSYNTLDEMIVDCLESLGKILIIDGNPVEFEDTGEFLYPFIKMKSAAYQHIGFRNMDIIMMKEATHDFKILGTEQHSQSQANVNPHKDELFSVKVLGGINFLVLEEFKALEPQQKQSIANAFYQFLTRYVGVQ